MDKGYKKVCDRKRSPQTSQEGWFPELAATIESNIVFVSENLSSLMCSTDPSYSHSRIAVAEGEEKH